MSTFVADNSPNACAERYVLLLDIDTKLFNEAFKESPNVLRQRNRKILDAVSKSSMLKVTNKAGTNLEMTWQTEYGWMCHDGFDGWQYEFPPGEVYARPQNVQGTLVLCAAMLGTIPIGRKYGLLKRPEVTLFIEKSKIVSISAKNTALMEDLEFCLSTDESTATAEEIGIGTNGGIKLRGLNYPSEERFLGLHLGFGAPVPRPDFVERATDHHLDFILPDITLVAGDTMIFDSGRFVL